VTIGKLDHCGASALRRRLLVRCADGDGRLGTDLRRGAATERKSRQGVGADLEAVATSQRDAVARPERPRSVSPDDRGGTQLDRREDVTGRKLRPGRAGWDRDDPGDDRCGPDQAEQPEEPATQPSIG
jgi:hypothetical protein